MLEKAYPALGKAGVKVGQSRMDCGSYGMEIIETMSGHSELFYIGGQEAVGHDAIHSHHYALVMTYRCTMDDPTVILVSYSYETHMKLQKHVFRVSYEFHMSMIRV